MNIYSLENIQARPLPTSEPRVTVGESQQAFAKQLKHAIEHINQAQMASDQKTEALARGEIEDLHDVMVTAQKASVTLQAGVEIQRKAVDAYNEILRMQV
ncbi:flagellar hook-basal body complex protein FliE [Gracilibacillus alcaliphilus]|uniref:flagellar hook-basal body complex protein FliE n=1 Tax=Gracilibacillus alcaliphilus TaxID=1401441 RepID=UPI001957CD81|nr:flagellar hook-basal body complex protein FliE [Gracilibacillus alcaliphilus]MBM7677930.1 flagellar hook-basal body complex protein FliE [Gracilibacillus alcaliphilus]